MSDVRAENIQSQLAELFSRLLTTDGPEAFESEAAKAIAGLSAMIYQARGPERLEAVLVGVPEAVERFQLSRDPGRRRTYQHRRGDDAGST
jgi:hypothetical protein